MDIILSTLNARYTHASFGLRYLLANLGEQQNRAKVLEFTIKQNPARIAEAILAEKPRVVGLGVYIWNARESLELVAILKRVAPELIVVLGGPEVSYEAEGQEIVKLADFVIQGEADLTFRDFCADYFDRGKLPEKKIISSPLPDVTNLRLPYDLFSDEDVKNRVIYVEASRGCPYKCEYCLSSISNGVRNFDVDLFLAEMQKLLHRGVRQFKFVDRTFNLSPTISTKILEFFLARVELGLFLHFEMVPDRLPDNLKALIEKFPAGALQFEIGIQTWNPEVAALVSRRQNYVKIAENLEFLTTKTGVHIHADLIAGLPGENLDSFAAGFDALAALAPHEIQVGILKRLKGTPIIRHDREWEMVYSSAAPFQILRTRLLTFQELQRIDRFAYFWNLYANSGNFPATMKLISKDCSSLFWRFWEFSAFLTDRHQENGASLLALVESAWVYLQTLGLPRVEIAEALLSDYSYRVPRDVPHFLREHEQKRTPETGRKKASLPERQSRHLQTAPAPASLH